MQTDEILDRIADVISTLKGIKMVSSVKTKHDREREITINFTVRPEEDHSLLDRADDDDHPDVGAL